MHACSTLRQGLYRGPGERGVLPRCAGEEVGGVLPRPRLGCSWGVQGRGFLRKEHRPSGVPQDDGGDGLLGHDPRYEDGPYPQEQRQLRHDDGRPARARQGVQLHAGQVRHHHRHGQVRHGHHAEDSPAGERADRREGPHRHGVQGTQRYRTPRFRSPLWIHLCRRQARRREGRGVHRPCDLQPLQARVHHGGYRGIPQRRSDPCQEGREVEQAVHREHPPQPHLRRIHGLGRDRPQGRA